MKRILLIVAVFLICNISNVSYAFEVNGMGFSFILNDINNIKNIDCSVPEEVRVSYSGADYIRYSAADLNDRKTLTEYHIPNTWNSNDGKFLDKWIFYYRSLDKHSYMNKIMPSTITDSKILPDKNGIIIISKTFNQTVGKGMFILGDKIYVVEITSIGFPTNTKERIEKLINTIYPSAY
ncbi:hypothetical protein [Pectinatus frisingensis]|uniref:hypothetical protein n=1 Tax=Pectinatus frisingensis TaxID=865 RepID=UPI0018C70240|nr:hypothetical protein [Pectinatus frisingensis]